MFEHEAVRRNLDTLAARGVRFVEPGEGYLACGWIGKGRLAEPDEIVAAAEAMLRPRGPLRGQRVLVTAGPTYEDVDPVRYVGNRSSGRMGFAIAAEAARRGAEVTLVAGPTTRRAAGGARGGPRAQRRRDARGGDGARRRRRRRRHGGRGGRLHAGGSAPRRRSPKSGDTLTLTLKKTPDILAELGQRRAGGGRAARARRLRRRDRATSSRSAAAKRERKHVDLIVANDVSRADAGFDVDTNAVTIVGADGAETLPLQSQGARRGSDPRPRRDAARSAPAPAVSP